ncbi:Iporin [Apis cerana cerana]|uniref:Iporin n=1 Tax=Apis cerana cerana TaxID=94128 RepID=A0A2A3ECG4_APICC|nr:Iporin [Apis cerana cerana]
MKIAEFSVGRMSPPFQTPAQPPHLHYGKRKRQERKYYNRLHEKCNCLLYNRAGKGAAVMEDPQTPGSDCNSNPATDSIQHDLISSEFVQDNVEYQWFIDYGGDGGLHVHPSVLSSLSASYSREDLGYYDDLARNLDANLAEIDMESFRTADIHTLLTALPVMCTDPVQHSEFNYQRERYASISGSVMEKLDIGSSISPHTSSQGEDSACSTTDTISICKSSLLFSPLKETPILPPGGSYSVDSLDCEDMLLTCQTNNKDNYTIAFEGSITMYSDGSQDFENQEKQKTYETVEPYYNRNTDLKNVLDLSMACSDSKIYTTWSNLKHSSMNKIITRHPSGNNNTIPEFSHGVENVISVTNKRSQSLPDLTQATQLHLNIPLNFSVDSAESNNHVQQLHSSGSVMSRSINEESSDNGEHNLTEKRLQNLSLVKLFMKQKSMSAEGMSLTLDQSDSTSDNGWPTNNSASDSGTNTNTQIQRQNINNISKHQVPEGDFSINWVKSDPHNNQEIENEKDIPKYTSTISEQKDEMMSSASVEELSENMSKSDLTHDNDINQNDFDVIPVFEHQRKTAWVKSLEKKYPICKTMGIQAIAETEDNSVQTSLIFTTSVKEKENPSLRETIVNKKPVYVVYPNYALPDLSFFNIKDTKLDNIALKPQCFGKNRVNWKHTGRSSRPFSCNDIDALRQRGFSHVKDWESLTFLLPTEYKKILHDVPEVSRHINIHEETRKPLFCLSPPMRHKTRTISEIIPNNSSSTSSTATQPSSGYRGSSTILTDSSTNQQTLNNTTNPLYLYRYDSISSEASLVSNEKKVHRQVNKTKKTCPSLPKRSLSLPYGDRETEFPHGKVPPRPPLPRSILRKSKVPANKRYSMFEMGDVEEIEDQSSETNKRMSLQEPYYMNNDLQLPCRGRIVDLEKDVDETEERYIEKANEIVNIGDLETENSENSEDDIKQLEEFLKRSGFSSQSSDGDIEDPDVKLRSYVRKFLALRMNKDVTKATDMIESQKKTVSFAINQRKKYLDNKINNLNVANEQNKDAGFIEERKAMSPDNKLDLDEKRKMILSANKAVDLLLKYWNSESIHNRQNYNDKNECAQICVSNLCPALYAIMSDGLKSHLNSTFGPITNSVWQVVEASSQQGPVTKTLNELVQKINGEDVITEGMLKFHAFVFGLLNLRALDAWFAYLCTRESILRKHYNSNSLFVAALANANAREVVDALLHILNPLAFCPFQLDLLYQYRQLHNSFGSLNNHTINAVNFRNIDLTAKENHFDKTDTCAMVSSPKKIRPRSCVAYSNYDDKSGGIHKSDMETVKKRLSNPIGSKIFRTLDKLASEDSEDYTDSLEHSPLNRASNKQPMSRKSHSPDNKIDDEDNMSGEEKFRKLQEKWELMVGKEDTKIQPPISTPLSPTKTPTNVGKSKIPRLLTSPVKQSNTISGPAKNTKCPISGIPSLKKPIILSTTKIIPKKSLETKSKDITKRTSRVDQEIIGTTRTHLTRPSSLPYKSYGVMSKDKNLISPQRRAASTSLPRPTTTSTARNPPVKKPLKEVRTVTHRMPSDNGHLAFGEGEKLKVILEVDSKWLLCARGDRKGLVPRMCVHNIQT